MSKKLWQKIRCSQSELQLKATLTGGQSFRYSNSYQLKRTR